MVFLIPVVVMADTYDVTFGWMDSTVYLPEETPVYEAKWRVAGGFETIVPGLTVPGGSVTITANPGDAIDIAARPCNEALCSDWSGWVTATAQHPPTVPDLPGNLTITVVRTGP